MKKLQTMIFISMGVMLFFFNSGVKAQHADPEFIQVVSVENTITLDGQLTENEWARRFDYLVFGPGTLPGDVSYTTTGGLVVDGDAVVDSSTTIVMIMHDGLDLYISLNSNDKYVNKWGGSWEGDGLFMKIQDATGTDKEVKMYFNAGGVNPDMVFETNASAGAVEGVGYKMPGTVVNDTTQIDAGYTAEIVIHLDVLGFTDPFGEVSVAMNIFDPDKQTGTAGEEWTIGSYYKEWWGSEWGGVYRKLKLADPPKKTAYATDQTITLDGQLTEGFWNSAESVTVGKGSGSSSGGWYMQWNDTLNAYEDQSMANVKFMHNGTDLYIGVSSDDKSVCKWSPGWEADGLFLWMTNKGEIPDGASRMEVKNMFFNDAIGSTAVFEVNGNVPAGGAEGASWTPAGTVSHTEIGGDDAGYTLETVVHTEYFGYSVGDDVVLSVVIWDMDRADAVAFDAQVSDYAPNWWGTQWVDPGFEKYFLYRAVTLSPDPNSVEPIEGSVVTSYNLQQNYPNPFNPTTVINYSIPENSYVSLIVYDILGNEVSRLVSQSQNKGSYNVSFDAKNLTSGVYFYTLRTNNFIQTRKMLLVK
ncbi:MAG: T9SS type A sorting domain-containing protein [bacterium]